MAELMTLQRVPEISRLKVEPAVKTAKLADWFSLGRLSSSDNPLIPRGLRYNKYTPELNWNINFIKRSLEMNRVFCLWRGRRRRSG